MFLNNFENRKVQSYISMKKVILSLPHLQYQGVKPFSTPGDATYIEKTNIN